MVLHEGEEGGGGLVGGLPAVYEGGVGRRVAADEAVHHLVVLH